MTESIISDEEWAAKVERATSRRAPETHATLHDSKANAEAAAAAANLRHVRRQVEREIAKAGEVTDDKALAAAVDADPRVVEATEQAEAARKAAADAAITFHLRALPPVLYDALQLQHPPTDEQEERGQVWNPHTFYPALLSRCSVRPVSVEQADAILNNAGNAGDASQLMLVLRQLNEQGHLSLGKGSRPTPS